MRRGRLLLLAWLSCAAWSAVSGVRRPVLAQAPFVVPSACGNEQQFRSELERLIGPKASEAMPSSLRIEVLDSESPAYVLYLQLSDGVRELRDPDCRALLQGAVVIVAANFAGPGGATAAPAPATTAPAPATTAPVPPLVAAPPPQAATSAPHDAAPPPPAAASAHAVAPATPPSSSSRAALSPTVVGPRSTTAPPQPRTRESLPARRARAHGPQSATPREPSAPSLGIGIGVSGGLLPGLAPFLELGAQLEPTPWGLALNVRYWPERSASREGRGVDLTAIGARASGRVRVAPPLFLGLGLEVNRLSGTGAPAVSNRNSDAAWHLAPSLELAAILYDVGLLRLELSASGRVSLFRPRFVVTGYGELYGVPELGADAILRGAWLFR